MHRLRQHVGDHFLRRLVSMVTFSLRFTITNLISQVQSITEPLECPRCHSLMWEPYQ